MTTAVMWEARANEGRAEELLDWVRDHGVPALLADGGLERAEVFTAPEDRVLVIAMWAAAPDAVGDPEERWLPELPDPPAGLLRRPVHRWRFHRVESYP